MTIKIKKFEELSTKELYEILKLRSEIFVVEQNCIYQDLDDIDYESTHVFIEDKNQVIAYLRYFNKKDKTDTIQLGRVVTKKHGQGLGKKLLEIAINDIIKTHTKKIFLEGQVYAIGFYEKFGFKVISTQYLEDGILHVDMQLEL